MTWEPEVREIARRRELALELGGEERIRDQRARGKLTVRERIEAIAGPGSFRERGRLAGTADYDETDLTTTTGFVPANFVMGMAGIDGRRVALGGGDCTARARPSGGGGGGGWTGSRSGQLERMALDLQLPLIRLIDGFGAAIRAVATIGRTYIPANPSWEIATA